MPHFAPSGGRSKSGILILFVDDTNGKAFLILWQSRRQTLTAFAAPEAEVVASSDVQCVVKTDSEVTLTQLRNELVTTRSRPFPNRFNYACDMRHGTSMHPAFVRAVFEPGTTQKADGLTKMLPGASNKNFASDLSLAP